MNAAMTFMLDISGIHRSSIVLAASGLSRVAWGVLVVATALLSFAWLYLMLSSRGATRPVAKCVALSVGAHLILLGWASLIQWFPLPDGALLGRGDVRVRWIDDEFALGDDVTVHDGPLEPPPVVGSEVSPEEPPADELPSDPAPSHASSEQPRSPSTPESAAPAVAAMEPLADQAVTEAPAEEPSALAPLDEDPQDADAEHLFTSTTTDAVADVAQAETVEDPMATREAPSAELPLDGDRTSDAEQVPSRLTPLPDERIKPAPLPHRYAGRTAEQRRRLAAARGGSATTEAAVEAGLAWLARAQNPLDGRWDNRAWEGGIETRDLGGVTYGVQADTAVTGLALLAFLGAGHTHQQGPYQENVRRGLQFLMQCQSRQTGSLAGDASHYVAMYCHGIATLALSEAMIMTQDGQLRPTLVRAVDYTVRSQHPITGGWRYQPGDLGDTSQFGWQLMALVSADAAGIRIPDRTWNGTRRWLDRVALGRFGGLACYTPDRPLPSPSMTAESLFCRAFMREVPGRGTIDEAADYVAQYGDQPDALNDFYFCYYATLALYQLQDDRWERWNRSVTDHLVRVQRTDGRLAGSWDCDTRWGRVGGRIYTTSMACLCLETYYRYLPVLEIAALRGRAIGHR